MARFHIHGIRGRDSLAIDLQADLLDTLETRVVAPVLLVDQLIGVIYKRNHEAASSAPSISSFINTINMYRFIYYIQLVIAPFETKTQRCTAQTFTTTP